MRNLEQDNLALLGVRLRYAEIIRCVHLPDGTDLDRVVDSFFLELRTAGAEYQEAVDLDLRIALCLDGFFDDVDSTSSEGSGALLQG